MLKISDLKLGQFISVININYGAEYCGIVAVRPDTNKKVFIPLYSKTPIGTATDSTGQMYLFETGDVITLVDPIEGFTEWVKVVTLLGLDKIPIQKKKTKVEPKVIPPLPDPPPGRCPPTLQRSGQQNLQGVWVDPSGPGVNNV